MNLKSSNKDILLDCDILIHLSKGTKLSILEELYLGRLVLLDIVREEFLDGGYILKVFFEQFIITSGIKEVQFPIERLDILTEYAKLNRDFGRGESACMAYARFHDNIIASSNLRDIKNYCKENSIEILTTMDIIAAAYTSGLLTEIECDLFIKTVKAKGSKLPCSSLREYL